ncbi:GNAT family N-acetyltransferase [Caldalkalibacillus mannanilyticus]|uniref:GNAT family N-acetyltransferase n=1 Tax=Caldalkalibacillus mannanilyticus TaxID=1418 RepID=UPI000469F4E1|nr:GNAT family N-acetyltransferase [Caldalkalibacillus mannanilyticus]
MDWYERLHEYFPEHEMKDPSQLKALLDDKDIYHKEETEDYLVLYAEFPRFIFIDYFLVADRARGKGIGSKVLNQFKQKKKMILLEAEPIDPEDADTEKRLAFYYKNGFHKATRIEYIREDEHGKPYSMNVLYWAPAPESEEVIMNKMVKACQEIHNFRSKKYYGRLLADPDKVLHLKQ